MVYFNLWLCGPVFCMTIILGLYPSFLSTIGDSQNNIVKNLECTSPDLLHTKTVEAVKIQIVNKHVNYNNKQIESKHVNNELIVNSCYKYRVSVQFLYCHKSINDICFCIRSTSVRYLGYHKTSASRVGSLIGTVFWLSRLESRSNSCQ